MDSPAPVASVDFETTYTRARGIGTLGVYHYLQHPETEIYMVSVWSEAGSFVGPPDEFDWESLRGYDLVSHNAAFDSQVLRRLQEQGRAPADFWPARWHCSADMAAFLGVSQRNLADSAKAHLGVDISKDVRDLCRDKTYRDMVASGFIEQVKEYALRDAEICYRLWVEKSHLWPEKERRLSELTRLQMSRGLPCDLPYLEESIQKLSTAAFEAVQRLPWAEGDEEKALSSILFAAECRKIGIQPPKSKAKDAIEALEWEQEHPEINWLADRREYLRANLLRTKLITMRDRVREDGRIAFGLKYFGAHTGRWSGDTKLNILGLTKETLHGANQRRVIHVSDPDKKLIIADLSQIEPRVLAWLTGNWEFLENCRRYSVYEAHARQTMGWTGGKMKDEDPTGYKFAKARVLGLGYGAGPTTFLNFAKTNMGIDLTAAEAKKTVNDFRNKETKIVAFWDEMDALGKASAKREEDLVIDLPSGRSLTMYGCHFAKTAAGKLNVKCRLGGGRWSFTWGSRTVENCLAGDTEVFTPGGWVRIDSLSARDLVHDGHGFVGFRGVKVSSCPEQTLPFYGLRATADHKFLTSGGWKAIFELVQTQTSPLFFGDEEKCENALGGTARASEGSASGWEQWEASRLATPLRLRAGGGAVGEESPTGEVLLPRVPATPSGLPGKGEHSLDVTSSGVPGMAIDAGAMPPAESSRLGKLRREGDHRLSAVAEKIRAFLGGHGADVPAGSGARSGGQRWGVLQGELSVGFPTAKYPKPERRVEESASGSSRGFSGTGGGEGGQAHDAVLPVEPGAALAGSSLCSGVRYEPVYDLINCGPRHQFLVRGGPGKPVMLAHNCTQAVARDVFVECLLRLEEHGLTSIFTVHDEFVLEVPKSVTPEEVAEIIKVNPEWMPDVPLDCEAEVSDFYKK
jgi:DNA polymerase I-like protein with 3'-5' exonuclease and polymerase domains